MSFVNFPDQIKVTLGTNFQAAGVEAGNKLERYGAGPEKYGVGAPSNTIILGRYDGSGWQLYSENGTDNTPNSSTNRMVVQFEDNPNVVKIRLDASYAGPQMRYMATINQYGTMGGPTYTFLSIFNNGTQTGIRHQYQPHNPNGNPISWLPVTATFNHTPNVNFQGKCFATMEEYVEPEPGRSADKTTYRYG